MLAGWLSCERVNGLLLFLLRGSIISRVCGLSRVTITKGIEELGDAPLPAGRVRRIGGGRPMLEVGDPELPDRLEALVDPVTRGDPESPLRWTSRSTRALAAALTADGHPVSHDTVAELLRSLGYSLQGTRKTDEGADRSSLAPPLWHRGARGRCRGSSRHMRRARRASARCALVTVRGVPRRRMDRGRDSPPSTVRK